MGNFIIKIIVTNIIIKINSQKTKFSSIKVVAKINKTLKINSGGNPKFRPKLKVNITSELNFNGGLAHRF